MNYQPVSTIRTFFVKRPSFDRLLTITKSEFLKDCVAKLCIAGLNATMFIMATIAKMLVILI